MSTAIGIELDLYVDIQSSFEEIKDCEHSMHNSSRVNTHSGEAMWYLQIACPNCGNQNALKAVCGKWARYVQDGGGIWCTRGCADYSRDWTIVVKERIGGKK